MVKKAVLAKFIKQGDHSMSEWMEFLPSITGLRVKGIGSQGEVLISLDSSGWFQPTVWLANYQNQVRQEIRQELSKAEATLPQEELEGILRRFVGMQEDSNPLDGDQVIRHVSGLATHTELSEWKRAWRIIDFLGGQLGIPGLGSALFDIFKKYPKQTNG